jgi:uncharacterized membrane protein YhaH (DUF805 family)
MNRPTYWLCYLLFMAVVSVLAYLGKLTGVMEAAMLGLGVPRLHDIGRSGWIVVGVIGIETAVIFGVAATGASVDAVLITAGVIFLVIASLGVWLGLIPGQAEANKWGEPPLPGIQLRKPPKRI